MRFNFMKDVPSIAAGLDFNRLKLDPVEWRLLSRVDGRNCLEEIRLLAGVSREEAERGIERLFDAGVVTIRREF